MPFEVPIQAIPNQSLTITLDSNLFEIDIRSVANITAVSITANGTDICDNIRAVAGSLIIPAKYLEAGNFIFLTANQELPVYTEFNVTQTLIYLTAAELASYRAPPTFPITEAFFDPNGALPLRFKPQGYT